MDLMQAPPQSDGSADNGYKTSKHKKTTFGTGLLKGLGITLRHLVSPAVTIEYPDVQEELPPRSRGVIALKTENCTVCMLCARECPDWCIYIEGHKEARESTGGKRAKKFNVLDRFAIDYALCMYCGICVEVCPYDALFWSPEFDYSSSDIVELTHEEERLNEWMYTVLPPPPLDEGAEGPELKAAPAPPPGAAEAPPEAARARGGPVPTVEDAGPRGQAPTSTPAIAPAEASGEHAPTPEPEPMFDPELVYKAVLNDELSRSTEKRAAEARARTAAERVKEEAWIAARAAGRAPAKPSPGPAPAGPAQPQAEPVEGPVTSVAPSEEVTGTRPPEPQAEVKAGVSPEEAAEIRRKVKEEQLAKGSDPRVAEARAKAAEMRALKGTKGPGD